MIIKKNGINHNTFKMRVKIFISALFTLFTNLILKIPFHFIRLGYLKLILGKLGNNSTVCRNVEIRVPRNVFIGNNTVINKHVLLDGRGGKLIIGDNVDIAQDVYIWTSQHDYNDDYHKLENSGVAIKDYAWIAARANILPGVTIGKGAVVGTCSVVTKNVEEMTVVAGIPAKKISLRESGLKYTLYHRPWFE